MNANMTLRGDRRDRRVDGRGARRVRRPTPRRSIGTAARSSAPASAASTRSARSSCPGPTRAGLDRLGSTMTEQSMISGNSARVGGLLATRQPGDRRTRARAPRAPRPSSRPFVRIRDGRAKRMLAGGSEGTRSTPGRALDAMKVLCRTHNDAPGEGVAPDERHRRRLRAFGGRGHLAPREPLVGARSAGPASTPRCSAGTSTAAGSAGAGACRRRTPRACAAASAPPSPWRAIRAEEIDAINGHLTATFADPLRGRELERGAGAAAGEDAAHSCDQVAHRPRPRRRGRHRVRRLGAGARTKGSCTGRSTAKICIRRSPPMRIASRTRPSTSPDMKVIAKASFGFGDVNGCVIFRKFEA